MGGSEEGAETENNQRRRLVEQRRCAVQSIEYEPVTKAKSLENRADREGTRQGSNRQIEKLTQNSGLGRRG